MNSGRSLKTAESLSLKLINYLFSKIQARIETDKKELANQILSFTIKNKEMFASKISIYHEYKIAKFLKDLNRVNEAIHYCKMILYKDSDLVAANILLGDIYASMNKIPDAIKIYKKCLRKYLVYCENIKSFSTLITSFLQLTKNKIKAFQNFIKQLIKDHPESPYVKAIIKYLGNPEVSETEIANKLMQIQNEIDANIEICFQVNKERKINIYENTFDDFFSPSLQRN